MISPTLTLEEACKTLWDVVIVGAGPAGSLAGRELAKHSLSVLVVDQASFPRRKLCGCCLNRSALSVLEKVGLGDLPAKHSAKPIRELQIFLKEQRAVFPDATTLSLSREVFDMALIREAVQSGAQFLPETHASLSSTTLTPPLSHQGRGSQGNSPSLSTGRTSIQEKTHKPVSSPLVGEDEGEGETRFVNLRQNTSQTTIQARVVIAADGLGGSFLQRSEEFHTEIDQRSLIGVGTVTEEAPSYYSDGITFMACSSSGYVGLVRLEDGRLNIAGALDPEAVKRSKGPGLLAKSLLEISGLPPIKNLEGLAWNGKPALTRRRRPLGSSRLFLIGDAAAYVEPFTGEGMAWALASGVAVVPFVLRTLRNNSKEIALEWTRRYEKLFGDRQRLCRLITQTLRRPFASRAALALFSFIPAMPRSLVKYVNAPIQ